MPRTFVSPAAGPPYPQKRCDSTGYSHQYRAPGARGPVTVWIEGHKLGVGGKAILDIAAAQPAAEGSSDRV